jgi:hypothetical protein
MQERKVMTQMENIILIGHGSPKKEANNIDLIGGLLHSALHPQCEGGCVKTAYLQFAEPDIMGTIRGCAEAGASKIIVHPFFLSSIPNRLAYTTSWSRSSSRGCRAFSSRFLWI